MPETLINTCTKEYTAESLLTMIREENEEDFYTSLRDDIAGVGLTVIGQINFAKYVPVAAPIILKALTIIGIGTTVGAVGEVLYDYYEAQALDGCISMLASYGGTITITTKTYYWEAGSGNSYSWRTETTYKHNRW